MMSITSHNQTPPSGTGNPLLGTSPRTSRTCVLIVEDHEDTRFMLRIMLERRGNISVVEAVNGEMAVELAERVHPDLILINGTLPLVDGYEATRRIRELTATRAVPIVFMSAHAQPAAEVRAFAAGCSDYLIKPYGLAKLDSVLERHLPPGKGL